MRRVLFFLFLLPGLFFSQNKKADSLISILNNAKHDTTRSFAYFKLGRLYHSQKPDTALMFYTKAQNICDINLKKINDHDNAEYLWFKRYNALLINDIGFVYQHKGDNAKALEQYFKSLKIREELGDKLGLSQVLNNIGGIYGNMGNIPKELEYLSKTLKMIEEVGDKYGIAATLLNIAFVTYNQGDSKTANEYYERSLKIMNEIGNKGGAAVCLNNMGAMQRDIGNQSKALEYYNQSLALRQEIGDKNGVAYTLSNIGTIYKDQGNYEQALELFNQGLKLKNELGEKKGISAILNNIASVYIAQKKYQQALPIAQKCMLISKELGHPENIRNAALSLSVIYKATNKYQPALENYELYVHMRDSLNNESTRKASIKSQLKYEYEKQAAADSVSHAKESEIKNVEIAKQTAEIKAKKNQQYALFGGLALVMIFAGFMYNRFKVTQRQKVIIESQKEIVEEQKKIVEEKQREIVDSIYYARRIQMAQIPSEKRVENTLKRLRS